MNRFRSLCVLCLLATTLLSACAHPQPPKDTVFQASTINALMEGVYDGETTFGELRKYGDTGLGTFNALDGEMIALHSRFFQVKSDGTAYPVEDSSRTPFAIMTFFDPDRAFSLEEPLSYKELEERLDRTLPTRNFCYAFRITGSFAMVRTRSVPRQTPPYPRLVEVVKTQPSFDLQNVRGTLIGFRFPEYLRGVNVPGYHFHFLTEDAGRGGHVLDCRLDRVKVEIDDLYRFNMALPTDSGFQRTNLTGTSAADVQKVEK
ncbi:MAG TPA: acetolactate decarboxylase [Syntrophobacteraceae bacterium]|nr:acetolactate decarboxylase [Syntrophobacteraceae bacterium]